MLVVSGHWRSMWPAALKTWLDFSLWKRNSGSWSRGILEQGRKANKVEWTFFLFFFIGGFTRWSELDGLEESLGMWGLTRPCFQPSQCFSGENDEIQRGPGVWSCGVELTMYRCHLVSGVRCCKGQQKNGEICWRLFQEALAGKPCAWPGNCNCIEHQIILAFW